LKTASVRLSEKFFKEHEKMKKFLSLILAGLMTVSCAAFVAADDAAVNEYADEEAYALEFLVNEKIWKGTSAEELIADADSLVERWHMALLVSRISTGWLDDEKWEDDTANDSTFTDLEGTEAIKYYGAISYANQNGIIEGYSADKFGPEDNITYRDALAMAVRTLGYKGLAYPWGYIQKAVELGLTEDIEAAYTQELTRGQVAIILYNAMFAATKSGETLAKSIFDVDFGWENIVIVQSDKATLGGVDKVALRSGYIAFKILNDDVKATLSAKTYFVKATELLGLEKVTHEDELAVGATYLALFKVGDDDIVSMVNAYNLYDATYFNYGNNDTPKEAKNELAKYELVDKYLTADHISAFNPDTDKPQIMVFAQNDAYALNGIDLKQVAIDIATLNILKADGNGGWTIEWWYNATVGNYYRVVYDHTNNKLSLDWMSEADFNAWYAEAIRVVTGSEARFELTKSVTDAPYAKLETYNLDNDAYAERALYKTYRLGLISTTTQKCGSVNQTYYTITDLGDLTVKDTKTTLVNACSHCHGWLNVNAEKVTTLDTTSMSNELVVYNYNKTTGEIEIIKHVQKNSEDADNTIITGILKGYSTLTGKLILDDKTLNLGYNAMHAYGSTYGKLKDTPYTDHQRAAANELDEYMLQYVTVYILDGKVIDVDIRNAMGNNVIVVLGYAGVSKDGYICVYGYSTADVIDGDENDLGVGIYKIASYNGWKRGDYTYYPTNAFADAAFVAGTIYTITSYDEGENAYNVYTQNIKDAKDLATQTTYTFDNGYRITNGTSVKKMEAGDKYLFVYDNGTIFAYTGIVTNERWTVSAPMASINGIHVFYVSPRDTFVGFRDTAFEVGFVLYNEEAAMEAYYDVAIPEDAFLGAGNYLLGSTQTKVGVTNLLNGKAKQVMVANNIDLVEGRVYVTLSNTIIGEWTAFGVNSETDEHPDWDFDHATCFFIDRMKDMYWDRTDLVNWGSPSFATDAEYLVADDYLVDNEPVLITMGKAGLTDLQIADILEIVPATASTAVRTAIADGLITATTYIDYLKDDCVTLVNPKTLADKYYYVAIVYDVDAKTAVVYIYDELTEIDKVEADKIASVTVDTWNYDDKGNTAVEAKLIADAKYSRYWIENELDGTDRDNSHYSIVSDMVLYFDTIYDEADHSYHGDVAQSGYLFGMIDHNDDSYFGFKDSQVSVWVPQSAYTSYDNATEYDVTELVLGTYDCGINCGMVKSVYVNFADITLKAGEDALVEFIIDGAAIEGAETGSYYKVGIKLVADDVANVTASVMYYKVNDSAETTGNVHNDSLTQVDLSKVFAD